MQWNETFGGANDDKAFSLVEAVGGGYTIAGYTSSFGAGQPDFWLLKTTPERVPDVALLDVTVLKPIVGYGYGLTIIETVENREETEQTFNLITYHNSIPLRTQILTLAAESNDTITFNWIPSAEDEGESTIWAAIPLHNLVGGEAFVSIPGDVNGDGKVDVKDVYKCGRAYGSLPGYANWNPVCDINNDNKVDIKDYYKACQNYGRFWNIPHDSLSISAASPVTANGLDASDITVTVKDEHGYEVLGANLVVVARAGIEWESAYPVEEVGNGVYTSHVVTTCSNNYRLTAYDCFWDSNDTVATFVPSPAIDIEVTATHDVTGDEPRAIIEAYAIDVYENVVEDANMTFTTDFGTIASLQEGMPGVDEATLIPDDWGNATVTAIDTFSGISRSVQVEFWAAHLDVERGTPSGENLTVPIYVYVPSEKGYLFFYSINIFFNSTVVSLAGVTDGNITDGFAAPNVQIIDDSTIIIYQTNQLTTASENVFVANLTFTSLLPEQERTIGVAPPDIYLKTIHDGAPEIWLQETPPPEENKEKPTKTYTATCWRIKKKDGTKIPTDDEIKKRMEGMERDFLNAAGNCTLPFIIKFDYKIKDIDWDEWKKAIDQAEPKGRDGFDDGKLDGPERKAMYGTDDWVDTDKDINIYFGFELVGCNGISFKDNEEDGKIVNKGRVFVSEKAEHDYHKHVLPHEVIHQLSKNKVVDNDGSSPKEAEEQGATKPGNLFNDAKFCTKDCKIGPDLDKKQGDLVKEPKKP